tara:strand:+ start:932 stop:2842 length:1911 start_codon:yes stop_codon:yes gene_type:complete
MNKKNINNLFYVDSLEGYNIALKQLNSLHDEIITDNPLLANTPNLDKKIIDISKLIKQKDGNKIGQIIFSMSNDIEKIFIKNKYKYKFKYYTDKLGLYLSIKSMCYTIIEKSLIFSIFFKKFKINKFTIIINKSDYFDTHNPFNFPRFSNISKFIAKKSFLNINKIDIQEIKIENSKIINNTEEKNIFLRVLVWPTSYIIFRLIYFINITFIKKDIIFYGKKCESLNETLAWLFFKGFKTKAITFPKLGIYKKKMNKKLENILVNDLSSTISKHLSFLPFSKSQINIQKNMILDHIYMGMDRLQSETKVYENFFLKNKIKYLISSSFYGPIANQIFYLCKKNSINFIGFEHGVTTSINFDSVQSIGTLESTTCNTLMVNSKKSKKEFDYANTQFKESINNRVMIIGEAEQKKKILLYWLQKSIMRNRFNIKYKEKTVAHISGILYAGNLKNSITSPIASYGYQREKNLLLKVYNNINKKVLYKPYPSQRLLYQPSYSKILKLKSNINLVGDFDFRYMRAVADIIVTDSNYSTLSWCIYKNTPVIYLKSSMCYPLLSKKLEKLFEDSFFVINLDKNGWESKLKELLSIPFNDLITKWNLKREIRLKLINDYILGPEGNTAFRAAGYINNIVNKFNRI